MAEKNQFHIADLVVFGLTIVISIGIGIYYAFSGGKQKTTSEFLLGGRLISFLPVAISLMVSFESSIMMLGIPAEGYIFGMQFIVGTLGFLISQLISINLIVPLLYPLKITSAYEYLEYRFNSKAVRLLGTLMGMLTYCWYMGIVLFGPAVALEAVTGFSRWTSIVTIAMVSVIYTSIGGLKAVIWTDVFQAFIMFAGIFAVLIKGTMEVGGPYKVWDIAKRGGRMQIFVFDLDIRTRHTFFNLLFSTIIRGFGLAFNQSTVQRISSTKSLGEAKRVLMIVAPAFAASIVLALYEGVVAYAYYETKGCDPFKSKQINNPNQIVPFFVMDIFSNLPGMPGLFLASLFSASLSTLSSGLSSLSAILWADIVHPLVGNISDFKGAVIAKLSVLVFGFAACGLAFTVSLIGGTLVQISSSVLASFGGPVTGLFLLGCFCHRSNAKGAFGGGIIGLVLATWISFGMNFSPAVKKTPWLEPASTDQCVAEDLMFGGNSSNIYHNYNMTTTIQSITTTMTPPAPPASQPEISGVELIYTISYTWIAPIGILSTVFFGYIISLLTGPNKPGEVDPRYLLAFSKVFFIFLPSSLQDKIGSIGAQFLKEEYKANFPDPAQRKDILKDESIIMAPQKQKGGGGGDGGEDIETPLLNADKHINNIDNNNNINGTATPAAIRVTDEKVKNSKQNGIGDDGKGGNRNSNGIVLHDTTNNGHAAPTNSNSGSQEDVGRKEDVATDEAEVVNNEEDDDHDDGGGNVGAATATAVTTNNDDDDYNTSTDPNQIDADDNAANGNTASSDANDVNSWDVTFKVKPPPADGDDDDDNHDDNADTADNTNTTTTTKDDTNNGDGATAAASTTDNSDETATGTSESKSGEHKEEEEEGVGEEGSKETDHL